MREKPTELQDGIEIDSLVKIDESAFDSPDNLWKQRGFNSKDAYRVLTIDKDEVTPRGDFIWLGPKDMSEADKYAFREDHNNKTSEELWRDISDLLLDETTTTRAHKDATRFRHTGLFMRYMLRKVLDA